MRIAVMGAGAVGGYFGARLGTSGANVSFIARGEHLTAMRENGLAVKSPDGNFEVRSRVASSAGEVGPVDLVLFCVKSQDTEVAGLALAPLIGEKTTVLSLQNGVDNPEKIARLWGAERVLAGVVYLACRISEPGVLEHSSGGRIVLGSFDPGRQETARSVAGVLTGARIPCEVSPTIETVLWKKLAWNAPFCALSCLLRMRVGEILAAEPLHDIIADCIEEVRAAAQCRGIRLQPSLTQETLSLSRSLGNAKPSMLHDLEAGKSLEYEALNGLVIRILHQARARAPVNEIFYAALKHIDQELRHRRTYIKE